jgi:Mycoplasma protein of unknown function, DUF285
LFYLNAEAILFNGDISSWDVRKVEEIWNIFDGAVSFPLRLCLSLVAVVE